METLVGDTTEVKFDVPSGLTEATFTIERNGVPIGTNADATISDGVASCVLPYAAIASDATVTVELTFVHEAETYVKTQEVSVVTPILALASIREILGPESTDEEARQIERAVRLIINAYTGQEFRPYIGSITVRGNGFKWLSLPMRLVSATSVNGKTDSVVIENSGFSLYGYEDYDYWPIETGIESHGVVISAGPRGRYNFTYGEQYTVNGVWGYQTVPMPVQEAARLLINDYACSDAAYRDRYLESIKAADWRLGFSPLAYQGTGNVRADQLLADYIMPSMGVI